MADIHPIELPGWASPGTTQAGEAAPGRTEAGICTLFARQWILGLTALVPKITKLTFSPESLY